MYQISADQAVAKGALVDGATMLLLDVPVGTIVGIDRQVTFDVPCTSLQQLLKTGVILKKRIQSKQ